MGRMVVASLLALGACSFQRTGAPATGVEVDAAPDAPVPVGDWWDPTFRFRAPISVTTTTAAIGAGYAVAFTADTAALVAAGRASPGGGDWRVVRHTGADAWQELDRWIDDGEGGGFNTPTTLTWFAVPAAIAAATTDGATYVYYGSTTPGDVHAELANIFLFADDFETTLGRWVENDRGETVTIDPEHRAGQSSLKILPGSTANGGLHRDLSLTGTVMYSHYVRQMQTNASLGIARAFEVLYADRNKGSWQDGELRLGTELDSSDRMQVWGDNGQLHNWLTPLGVNTWRRIDTVHDMTANTIRVRGDGGPWVGPFASRFRQATPVLSIGLEGEGQSGTFWIDNFVIRPYVDPEPTAALGPEEPRLP